jgi:putative transposase
VIVFGERSMHQYLSAYVEYYHRWRTHLALGKDAPEPRRTHLPIEGRAIELRELGGLHHHYERRAA